MRLKKDVSPDGEIERERNLLLSNHTCIYLEERRKKHYQNSEKQSVQSI